MAFLDRLRAPSLDGSRSTAISTRELLPEAVRDPRAATVNTHWRSGTWGMVADWNATDAIRWAYYANTYVFACVRAIAQDISALAFRAGASLDTPETFNTKAPLAVLLGPPPGGPAPTISARRLWGWTVAQYIVTGRWAWELDLSAGGKVAGLYPLISANLRPIPSSGGTAWWSGFQYDVPSKRIDLPPERVIYDWRPGQLDFREPESVLQAARLDISVAVMQDRYDYAFLQNDARPAAVVVHERFEEEGQKLAWRRNFLDNHQGPDRAGKVAWAEVADNSQGSPKDALFIQSLGLTQADAEFIARYEMKIRAICVALGVPLSRLGDSSKRTFSNADRETINYWRNTVWPILTELQDTINMQLAPRLGREVGWFDTSGVAALREAPRWAPADGQAMVDAGTITANEHRKELGLPPKPDGGDEFQAKPVPPAIAPPALVPAVDPNAVPVAAIAPVPEIRLVREARGEVADFVKAEQANQRRAMLWHQTNRAVVALETQWTRKIQRLFNDQRDSTIARLEGKRGRQHSRSANPEDISHAYDRVYWDNRVKELTADLYETVMTASGVALSSSFDIAFDIDAPYAQEFILGRANMLAGQINDTTYGGIKEQLAEGAAQGDSIPHLADRIRTLFEQTYKHRAETVARTEVISGYNGSTATVLAESDQVMGMEWIATRDKRTRKTHAAMDGTTIRLGEFFQLDGATIAYPGDPNVSVQLNSEGVTPNPAEFIVNCRCTIVPVLLQKADATPRQVPVEQVRQTVLAFAMGRVRLDDALAMLAS